MGMFSWKCNGCKHELVSGELVRLNDVVTEYDGYGSGWQGGRMVAWHERCYQDASPGRQKQNQESESAPGQGFGPAKLEFLPGFDEDMPVVVTGIRFDTMTVGFIYVGNDGELLNWSEWNKRCNEAIKAGEEFSEPDPADCMAEFPSLEAAIDEAGRLLSSDELQDKKSGVVIYGRQNNLEGAIYEHYPWEDELDYNFEKSNDYTKVEVEYEARFKTTVKVRPGEYVSDAVLDIDPGEGEYVQDSFMVIEEQKVAS